MGQKSIWLTSNHIIGYIGQDNYANFFPHYDHVTTSIPSHPRKIHAQEILETYPRVVIVTIVYQKAAGIEVNVVFAVPFSA